MMLSMRSVLPPTAGIFSAQAAIRWLSSGRHKPVESSKHSKDTRTGSDPLPLLWMGGIFLLPARRVPFACGICIQAGVQEFFMATSQPFTVFGAALTVAIFSPAGMTAPARLWDIATGRCLKIFKDHKDGIRPVAWHPAGTRIFTGSFDCTAKLWEVDSGRCIRTYAGGHDDWIRSICISRDDTRLITAGKDKKICFWDIKTGDLLATLYNTDDGFLWTSPPDTHSKNGVVLDRPARTDRGGRKK